MGESVLFTKEEIQDRVKELRRQIGYDIGERKVVFVGILKGAFMFMADVVRGINLPVENVEIDFMQVESYIGKESSGVVTISKEPTVSMEGKVVVVVEDIIDTGRTMKEIVKYLHGRGAAEVKVAAFLDKPAKRVVEFKADYVGFEIDPLFVVGYGLDCEQKYRTLPDVLVFGG